MSPVKRLLSFIRPYTPRFFGAVFLMAVVGACEVLMAFLVKPIFDNVLAPAAETTSIFLFQWPFGGHAIYLQDILPGRVHNAWTVVAIAIIAVTMAKGLAEFFGI